jgi:hypothetical protein
MTDSPEEEATLEADAKAYHADDLVKRLREVKDWWREPGRTAEQAADRIEQLEAALREIACDGEDCDCQAPQYCSYGIARLALGEKKE